MSEEEQQEPAASAVDDIPKEEVDPALPEKALEDLRARVHGNGIKPEHIALKDFKGEVIHFEAHEVFKIASSISERHANGRENGIKAGSHQDAHHKIKAEIEKLTADRELKRLTASFLKKRRDSGYGINNLMIDLKRYNKAFVVHEPCGPCDSTGKTLCQNCHGQKMINCIKCHGQRELQCHICHGSQFIETPQGRQQCTQCHGRGQVGCDKCQQTGEVTCPKCQATGKMPCHKCNATGWHSHIFQLNVKAKGQFRFDPEQLPEELPPLIEEYGPRLITEGHADARIIEAVAKEQELNRLAGPDEYIIPYHVKLPWGDIEFSVGEKAVLKAKLFGYNPALLEMPDFLEKTLAKGLTMLAEAARSPGDIAGKVARMVRYKAIGETFLIVGRVSPQKATQLMQERYPYGLSPATLQKMVQNAHSVKKQLIKKPRLMGLAGGGVFAALLFIAYFMGPLRTEALASFIELPEMIIDLAMIIIGGGLITAFMQFSAGQALQKALGRLLKQNKRHKAQILPKAGESALLAYPVALSLFLLIMFAAGAKGAALPDWLIPLVGG